MTKGTEGRWHETHAGAMSWGEPQVNTGTSREDGVQGDAPQRAVWSQGALGVRGTLRVRGAPSAKEEPPGDGPGWAGSEARAVWNSCPPCWASSPFRLLPPAAVTLPVASQCVSPALG